MRITGQCNPGGPMGGTHVPLPTATVVHQTAPPVPRKPMPARRDASRGYIRAWAVSHGFHVATQGALPKKVTDAYAEALKGNA